MNSFHLSTLRVFQGQMPIGEVHLVFLGAANIPLHYTDAEIVGPQPRAPTEAGCLHIF